MGTDGSLFQAKWLFRWLLQSRRSRAPQVDPNPPGKSTANLVGGFGSSKRWRVKLQWKRWTFQFDFHNSKYNIWCWCILFWIISRSIWYFRRETNVVFFRYHRTHSLDFDSKTNYTRGKNFHRPLSFFQVESFNVYLSVHFGQSTFNLTCNIIDFSQDPWIWIAWQ